MNWLNRSYPCNKKIRLRLEDQVRALTSSQFSHFLIFRDIEPKIRKSEGNRSYSSGYHQKVNWLNRSYACNKEIRLTLEDQVKALTLSPFSHFFIFWGYLAENLKNLRKSGPTVVNITKKWTGLTDHMHVIRKSD